jgi:hypothetical protein
MKRFGLGLIIALGLILGIGGFQQASAAPISGAPIAQSAAALNQVEHVWYDRFGVWHPNRRGAVIVAPPVYVAPPVVVAPVCGRVWVCGPRGCFWKRRC